MNEDATPLRSLISDDERRMLASEENDLRQAMIIGLATAADDLTSSTRDLTKAVGFSRVEKRWAIALVGLLAVLCLITAACLGLVLGVVKENRAEIAVTRDCTEPGGQCFAEREAARDAAMQRLLIAQVEVLECLRRPENRTDAAFEACVAENTQTQESP
jgi:hypothetical protein